jgi:hypothetical protein
MSASLRKLLLTFHVSFSVGWLGAVAAFLALALAGLNDVDPETMRGIYVGMDATTRFVIVPLSVGSLVTGMIQSLATPWGLVRHHWVVAKLFITVVCTVLLWVHMRPITYLGGQALHATVAGGELRGMKIQLVVDAAAGMIALLVATALSVYKPKGTTAYGRRKLFENRRADDLRDAERSY